MGRAIIMLVSLLCYAAFFAAFLYLIGFAAGLDQLPTNVDKGVPNELGPAIAINFVLIALFGIQHSVMARKGFKESWTKIIPAPLERSVFCLATALVLFVLFSNWQTVEGSLWSIQSETGRVAMWALFLLGWTVLLITTFLLNHFELFGVAQAWRYLRGQVATPPSFKTPLFYKVVRHPLYFGFFLGLWATPDMTYSHLMLAVGFTIYILVGITYEERDLVAEYGEQYRDYQRRVGSFLPWIGKKA